MDDIANDIHCAKQDYSDDSDRETATAKTILLKTYPELNECFLNKLSPLTCLVTSETDINYNN
ncbi:hypothetical protein D917_10690 [Trichinella nativa]|uniref:Uncharacterized protein n=1 Tax=Trichinella nativa TaxID=6335 RepID=A0A1Y3EF89_9BILA|nr:hypothetical protein D917_10690 [Trichinella nativa]